MVGWGVFLKLALCLVERMKGMKDNMGWSGWEEFRNLIPNDKTN
jgi:hypothetical protein